MIKFSDAELISVLPNYIKDHADVQAISYAYRMGMAKLLAFSRLSIVYGNLDEMPDYILDLMALEMRSQYYDETMDAGTKRNIIRNSLIWYAKGGTVSAVNEMIATVFGEGAVEEWYEFGGKPGTFRINSGAELSPDIIRQFNEIIDKVKNKRSHLINVSVNRKIDQPVFLASHVRKLPHVVICDSGINHVRQAIRIAVGVIRHRHSIIRTGGIANVS